MILFVHKAVYQRKDLVQKERIQLVAPIVYPVEVKVATLVVLVIVMEIGMLMIKVVDVLSLVLQVVIMSVVQL